MVVGKSVKHLRRQGLVPAVLYGHATEPTPLTVNGKALQHTLARAGANRLIALYLDKGDRPRMVLAREVQRDSLTRALLHVDFYEVVMTEKIRAEIPIVFVGESPVVKRGEGLSLHGLDSIEVECLPGNLISSITVDLSALTEIDQAVYVKDLTLGRAITVLTHGDELVAKILPPRVEKIEEVVVAAPEEVEVIAKGKKEEEIEAEAGKEEEKK
jgi:large subunit ribosomal protein L25